MSLVCGDRTIFSGNAGFTMRPDKKIKKAATSLVEDKQFALYL